MDPFGAAAAVITAYTVIRWIYNHSFDSANTAERKCREFGAAITGLVRAIQDIEQDFGHAWRDDDCNGVHDARAIKQDFVALLGECEHLLARHAHLHYTRANVLQNVTWGANIQPKVDQMLGRIALQTQRATFIYSNLSYKKQSEVSAQIHHLIQVLDPQAPRLRTLDPSQHTIQPALVDSFRRYTYRKPPQGFQSLDEFPFRTGLNTLRNHLEQSTMKSSHGEPQTIHQHISLLKAQWLLQTIKNLDYFQRLRAGDRDRREVQEVENSIVDELTRQDLTLYSLDELLDLPSNHFFIWQTTPQNVLRNLMQPFGEEKEILDTELPAPPNYQQCKLVAFRDLGNSQGTIVRLARQWKRDGQLLPPYNNRVDAFSHVLKPLYALDASSDQHLSVEICNADGGQGETYQFKELKDVFKLQWALSNYNVFSDFEDVDWAITRSMKTNINAKGSRIQIWWYDPDDELEKVAAQIINPASGNSGRNSILSTMTGAAGRSIIYGSGSRRGSTNPSHNTEQSESEAVEAIPPYEPLLVVFAWREKRYEYFSLKLHGQMYIDQAQCGCKKEEHRCPRAVLRSGNGVECQVKQTYVDQGRPRDLPNLNIFARSYRKGGRQHPLLDSAVSVKTRELTLDFATPAQRRRFNQQFEFILKLQRSREQTHALLLQRAVFLSNRPLGVGNVRHRITGSIEANGSSPGSSRQGFSPSTIRSQSDLASRSDSWEYVSNPPDSAISSSFEEKYELSQANYT